MGRRTLAFLTIAALGSFFYFGVRHQQWSQAKSHLLGDTVSQGRCYRSDDLPWIAHPLDFSSTPYLGLGWMPAPSLTPGAGVENIEGTVSPIANAKPSLWFYLTNPRDLEVALEFQIPKKPTNKQSFDDLELSINGQTLSGLKIEHPSPTQQTCRFSLPAKMLKSGANRLVVLDFGPSLWASMKVSPSELNGRPMPLQPPHSDKDSVPVEVGSSWLVPVPASTRVRVAWDDLVLDGVAGTVPLKDWKLRLWLGNSESEQRQSIDISQLGKGVVELGGCPGGSGCLGFSLSCADKVRPGQVGLRWVRPRIETLGEHPDPLAIEPTATAKAAVTAPTGSKRPNVLIYLIDTLRSDQLGCYGFSPSPSPNLDAFSQDGVLFYQGVAQSGWTKPSSASVLTGLYPWEHGAQDFADKIRPEVTPLASLFKQSGYRTDAVVTNYFVSPAFDFNRGFDRYAFHNQVSAFKVNQLACQALESGNASKPFFLYLHTLEPHAPYEATSEKVKTFNNDQIVALMLEMTRSQLFPDYAFDWAKSISELKASYRQEIVDNDRAFGELIGYLKAHGQYDNTMIVVVSDHGEEFGEHGSLGHINSLYQELLHVPLLIKFPNSKLAGTKVDTPWQQVDIAPTILGACGQPIPKAMSGLSFLDCDWEHLRQRVVRSSIGAGRDAERFGQGTSRWVNIIGVRQGKWLLNQTFASNYGSAMQPVELFDLSQDPQQKNNLAYTHPAQRLALQRHLNFGLKRGPEFKLPKSDDAKLEEHLKSLQYLR